ncbi:normocyte-binding protein [Paenibacillus sp. CAA11]|uniref:normocyte-binding protein n=1 Tax=Paenibacillus sp. CAA11 TaxID=1532905 RepID=UPI000D37A108|nr:normocyte-binding protein [Paenibacillus sp. CAA11]AWB43677.1 normocyte-binding protein [Paenibacillus sp. CAA11]
MKDIVLDRLNKMEDLQQRRILRSLMTSVFLNLTEYQEELNRKVEERVFGEVVEQDGQYDIYGTICHRDERDPLHEYLFPMLPEDGEPEQIDLNQISLALAEGVEARLFTIYLECSHLQIRSLLQSGRTFTGQLVTQRRRYEIRVRLQQNRDYIDEIDKLYPLFLKNGQPWKTVNHPYVYKFVDVILTGCDQELDAEEEEITEVTIQLEEFEKFKRTGLIPLWNIQRLELKTGGFPVPAADRVNFEHVLPLRKLGLEHGYLVEGDEDTIRYIKRTAEEITVVSPREKSDTWRVLRVVEPTSTFISKPTYALMTNRQKSDFVGNYGRKHAPRVVRSKGEVLQLIHSFEAASLLEFIDLSIAEHPPLEPLTYELNHFLTDDIRSNSAQQVMRLIFSDQKLPSELRYMAEDLMSFLVSQVQLLFPEYRCEGEWA